MAEPDDVEDPKAGAPAEGQDSQTESEAPEGEQPEAQPKSIEDEVAELRQQLAEERRRKKQAQGTTRQLQARLDQLETQVGSIAEERVRSQRAQILQSADQRAAAAEAALAEAQEEGDPKAIAAAQRALVEAVTYAGRVKAEIGDDDGGGYSQRRPQQAETRPQPQAPQNPHAAKWAAKNAWYGNQADPDDLADSYAAHAESIKLANEGYDAGSADYWAELDKRVAKRLPHRFPATPRANGAKPPAVSAGAGRAVVGARPGEIDGIPEATLEFARQAGMPVNDPAYRKALAASVREVKAKYAR